MIVYSRSCLKVLLSVKLTPCLSDCNADASIVDSPPWIIGMLTILGIANIRTSFRLENTKSEAGGLSRLRFCDYLVGRTRRSGKTTMAALR
jgi:hypothetical protein